MMPASSERIKLFVVPEFERDYWPVAVGIVQPLKATDAEGTLRLRMADLDVDSRGLMVILDANATLSARDYQVRRPRGERMDFYATVSVGQPSFPRGTESGQFDATLVLRLALG